MRWISLVVLFIIFSGCTSSPQLSIDPQHLVDRGEQFCLANGVNEFDLVEYEGDYLLFSHDFETPNTMVRRASNIEDLAKAIPIPVFFGKYPTVIFDNGYWHAWAYDAQSSKTIYYRAEHWSGPYLRKQEIGIKGGDWHVRRNPEDGMYYATYKSLNSMFSGIARAAHPDGPWNDLGWIFDSLPRPGWHAFEEADPAISFQRGRAYVLFAGWNSPSFLPDGGIQRLGMVELDMKNFRAKQHAVILLEPNQEWQRRAGSTKIFNPVLMETQYGLKIFYAHNPSASGVCAGFGVVDIID